MMAIFGDLELKKLLEEGISHQNLHSYQLIRNIEALGVDLIARQMALLIRSY
jgi:hypothetical protein